jgi:DNA-binding GntR family transcriptional regulator
MKYKCCFPDMSTDIEPTVQTSPAARRDTLTALQLRLAAQIADWIRREGLRPGEPINQLQLAERFGVSRTPVKAALQCLSDAGAVRFRVRGVEVADVSAAKSEETSLVDPADYLIRQLAADRHRGDLAQEMSEADLMRRYSEPRPAIVSALRRLAELGVVSRKPGFGWRFVAAETPDEKRAAYSFRMAIEPAALLEPGYSADAGWIADMQARHRCFLARTWSDSDAVSFFEMNADFHLGLVSFSKNRFFVQAIKQQNSLRRLRNYSWRLGPVRVRVSCEEHLGILAAVGSGDLAKAATLLRDHLAATSRLVAGSSGGTGT